VVDEEETVINLFMAWEGTIDLADSWIIDLGTTSPMTARKEWMTGYTSFDIPIPISLGDNRTIKALGSGSVQISMDVDGKSNIYELRNIYYVPDMGTNNLLSVTYMVNKGYFVSFGAHKCEITRSENVIGKAEKQRNLWILQGTTVLPTQESAHIANVPLELWHRRLGHAMTQSIEKLSHQSMVTGLDIADTGKKDIKELCMSCLKGKSAQNVIPKKSDVENPRRLHRLFLDVCRPFDIEGYSQCRYFVTLIDGFSHYMWVKPIRSKDEASKVLIEWITQAEVETGEKPNI